MAGISKKKIKTKKGEVIKYTITYYDIFGKQHTSGIYDTIKDAKKDLHKFEKIFNSDKNVTIGEILSAYINECKKKNRTKSTIEYYERTRDLYLKDYLLVKYFKMSKINWQELIYALRNDFSPHVADGCYRTLRAVFNWAKEENLIEDNTFAKVKTVPKPDKLHNHFDVDEVLKLLEICKRNFIEYYPLFFTLVGTGMREGEIFGLLKENIDFEKNIIKVCSQFTKGEFKKETKTKKIRLVYMFPTLAHILKKHIENDTTASNLVFHNSKGNFLNPSNVRNRFWLKLLELAGYPPNYARIHDLRGTNTDLAAVLELPITFSQEQLGHASPTTTLQNYAQTNSTMRKIGVNKFEEIFKKCEQNESKAKNEQKSNVVYLFPNARTV